MTNLLQTGSDFLEAARHAHLTQAVVYERGADNVSVQATIGRTEFEVVDGAGYASNVEARDFLIRTVDLVLNSQQTLPVKGDRIKETNGTTTYTYEVMAPGGEPVFRFSDPQRKTLRVHTKLVETDPV